MVVGVVAQQGNERAERLAAEIADELATDGIEVWIDAVTAETLDRPGTPVTEMDGADLVASIGGDGTFLFTARALRDTPIVGINLGEVGFLTAVAPAQATTTVSELYADVDAGTVSTKALPRVTASGDGWTLGPALNEITVHAPNRGPQAELTIDIAVDGNAFTADRADGMIVATPTGSTAYNLSEGGPLLTPRVSGLVITEMCGRSPMPPLVIPLEATVSVALTGPSTAVVIADGRTRREVSVPTTVTVQRAATPLNVAGPQVAFLETLEKLA